MSVPAARPTEGTARVRFVGNATLLIRYGPFTLLTDPNFLHRGEHAYLGKGLVSRRLTEPAFGAEEVPDLDAVVLSHLHGDHFDRRARRALDRSTPILTTPHASRRLQGAHGFHRAVGLRTWQDQTLVKDGTAVRVTSVPGRHAGSPAVRALLPPVMGSVLEFGPVDGPVRLRLHLSGDTLVFEGLREISRRFAPIHLAAVHLGGTTLPGGLLVTMDGAQGAEWVDLVRPEKVLPVHYEDYTVMRSPLSDFLAAVAARGHDDRLLHCPRGGTVEITGAAAAAPVPDGPGAAPGATA